MSGEVSATGRALASAAKQYGLTQRELASMLGVSDRMVRQVLSGAKPGRNLEAAAKQLAGEGRITERPTRREQRVRTPSGVSRERVKPTAAGTPGGAERVRTSAETGGRRQTVVETPARGLGRERSRAAILSDLEARRGGQRDRGGRRVTIRITTKAGNTYTLGGKGGYDPKQVARRMRGEGDPFEWLADEAGALTNCTGSGGPPTAGNITAVQLTYF